jgi:hypothetical protein
MTSGHDHRHQLLADPSKVTGPSQREPTTGTRQLPHRRTTPSDAPEPTQCGREFETSGFPAAQDLYSPSQHLPSTGHWSNQAIELQYKSAGHRMIKSGRRGARTHNPRIHGRSSTLTAVVPSELRRRGPGSGPHAYCSPLPCRVFRPFPVRQPRQESGLGLGCHAFSRGNPCPGCGADTRCTGRSPVRPRSRAPPSSRPWIARCVSSRSSAPLSAQILPPGEDHNVRGVGARSGPARQRRPVRGVSESSSRRRS